MILNIRRQNDIAIYLIIINKLESILLTRVAVHIIRNNIEMLSCKCSPCQTCNLLNNIYVYLVVHFGVRVMPFCSKMHFVILSFLYSFFVLSYKMGCSWYLSHSSPFCSSVNMCSSHLFLCFGPILSVGWSFPGTLVWKLWGPPVGMAHLTLDHNRPSLMPVIHALSTLIVMETSAWVLDVL